MSAKNTLTTIVAILSWALLSVICSGGRALARDLMEIKAAGVLRHLGIPYANFVTGGGEGLDVELVKRFAKHLGVKYRYVSTDWGTVISDLTGLRVKPKGEGVEVLGKAPVKGDIIANGLTVLAWREKVVEFSVPTFPTQVWLVTTADSPLRPITATGDTKKDISLTRKLLKGLTLLGKSNTCLDPSLYDLEKAGANSKLFTGSVNDLAPAIILGEAKATLLDVPDALVALGKWPGKIKILGPLSQRQDMALAFAKSSPKLREAFNRFFARLRRDGTYAKLVDKYYPLARQYYPGFFKQ